MHCMWHNCILHGCRPHTDTFLVVQESHVHPGTHTACITLQLPCLTSMWLYLMLLASPMHNIPTLLWLQPTCLTLYATCAHSKLYNADNKLKPLIEELEFFPNKTSYRSLRACDLELELTHENKGIESIQFYDAGQKGTQFSNTHTWDGVCILCISRPK